jgi:hypothetical protein
MEATKMRPFRRKSELQRLIDTVSDALDVPGGLKGAVPSGRPGKAVKAALITAGGLAGLTAGSAGISSLRRQREGAGRDS